MIDPDVPKPEAETDDADMNRMLSAELNWLAKRLNYLQGLRRELSEPAATMQRRELLVTEKRYQELETYMKNKGIPAITDPHDPATTLMIREHFAAQAMGGLLVKAPLSMPFEGVAALAVQAADALIAELNRKPEETP
jgi:hypothetical protein